MKAFAVSYTPKKADYVQASRVLASKTAGFRVIAVVVVLVMVASLLVLLVPLGGLGWRNTSIVALVVGGFYFVYFYLLIPLQLKQAYKSNPYLQHERSMNFSDEGVLMLIDDKKSLLSWEHFEKVIDAGDFYLLIYSAQEKVFPFIPKKAFQEIDSEAQFKTVLTEKSIPLV